MRPRPKPDSSYASNRLTRNNGPRGHLLSTFNMAQDEAADEHNPTPEPVSESKAPEPGTDDEPISSSEDELAGDPEEIRTPGDRSKERTLREKLEAPSSPAPARTGAWGAQSQGISARKGALRRTSSMMTGDDDEQDEIFSSYRSSQNKRFKTKTYPSASFSKAPSSSALSATTTPDKRGQKSKTFSRKEKNKEESSSESESESEAQSTTAMEIDSPSPDDSHTARQDSPGFIVPPLYPGDSKTSLETAFSKDGLPMALNASLDSSSSSPLSSAPSEFLDLLESEEDTKLAPPRKWLCPMCKEEVDPDLLLLFEAQPKQRVREQQRFCASHKQNKAEGEWKKQGYPDINWDNFDERIKKHFPELEKLLAPSSPSYYHNTLATIMKDGKAKNFRLTMMGDGIETISCGYYGTKGAGMM